MLDLFDRVVANFLKSRAGSDIRATLKDGDVKMNSRLSTIVI